MSSRVRQKFGFTLWDLNAVLAAGAILVCMLLPTLQSAREKGRDVQCRNRIRNIGLACLDYEAVNGRIPAVLSAEGAVKLVDWFDFSPNRDSHNYNQHTSIFVQILPFMGLGELLDNVDPFILDFDNGLVGQTEYEDLFDLWFGGNSGADNLRVDLKELACPSDDVNSVLAHGGGQTVAIYQDDPSAISQDFFGHVMWILGEDEDGGRFTGERTNYVGCLGANSGGDNRGGELGAFRGSIGHREVRTLNDIPDGQSNTVLVGEHIGAIQWRLDTGEFDRNFTQLWYLSANVRGRGEINWRREPPHNTRSFPDSGFFSILNAANPDFPDPRNEPDPRQGILGSAFHARSRGFGSMHPDGVNFVMLDGSVRQIARTDDWKSLYAVFGAFDGVGEPRAQLEAPSRK